jgi:hypothetical protein
LVATSGTVSDQKAITVNVYQSLEELLRSDLEKYKEDLQNLYIDIKVAEREGKDTTTVLELYNEAKNKIDGALQDLENNRTADALDKSSGIPKLITRARDLLNNLGKIEEKVLFPTIWIILIVFIVIIVVVIVLVVAWKKKKIAKIRPYIIPLGRIVEAVKKKGISKEEAEIEKEKLNRMIKILEKERDNGTITGSSYEKMKKSLEEKLSKLEKK